MIRRFTRPRSFGLRCLLLSFVVPFSTLWSSPVSWEIYQAFPSWIEGERFRAFVKVTNVSEEVIPLAGDSWNLMIQQTRLVPKWKEGMQHLHGGLLHSHHLPQAAEPWKADQDWVLSLKELERDFGRALRPGQSEVLGDLSLRGLWHRYKMPNTHLESFQLALRLGPDRYAFSQPQSLIMADVAAIETHPVIGEYERVGGKIRSIREVEIDGEKWLFRSRFRIARVPEGATPRFRTEDQKETLVIEFDGVDEEPVRIDVRQLFPQSGSERTVPHLHLWRSLTDRSMHEMAGTPGGFYKESGLTLQQAFKLKWDGSDPELKAASFQPEDGADPPGVDAEEGEPEASSIGALPESVERQGQGSGRWLWLGVVITLLGLVASLSE